MRVHTLRLARITCKVKHAGTRFANSYLSGLTVLSSALSAVRRDVIRALNRKIRFHGDQV